MERLVVKSKNFDSIGYEQFSKTLEIKFNDGDIIHYKKVPNEIYNGLIASKSKTQYFKANIGGKYPINIKF